MKTFTSEHSYLCGKCGGVIKVGTPFLYFHKEDGKPVILRVHVDCVKEKYGTTRKADK